MHEVAQAFETHMDAIIQATVEEIVSMDHPFYSQLPRDVLSRSVNQAFSMVLEDLKQDTNTHFANHLARVGEQRLQQGATPSDVMGGFDIGINRISGFFKQHFADRIESLSWWFERIHQISHAAAMVLADTMLRAREHLIQSQDTVIRELSTPLMPIHEGVLVMPLVGELNESRATQVMETLLVGISELQADTVIMDITGIAMVDTRVANYIVQTAKAVRLLGAELVIVGIKAEVAQALVQLGIDFNEIITHATLQDGMQYAIK